MQSWRGCVAPSRRRRGGDCTRPRCWVTVAEKDIAAAVARSAAAMIARRGRHGGRAIKVRFNGKHKVYYDPELCDFMTRAQPASTQHVTDAKK